MNQNLCHKLILKLLFLYKFISADIVEFNLFLTKKGVLARCHDPKAINHPPF